MVTAEKWISGVLRAYEADPYGAAFPEFGLEFLTGLVEAGRRSQAASNLSPEQARDFVWALGNALSFTIWDRDVPVAQRGAALRAAVSLLDVLSRNGSVRVPLLYFWAGVLQLRELRGTGGDADGVVAAATEAIVTQLKSSSALSQLSALEGIRELGPAFPLSLLPGPEFQFAGDEVARAATALRTDRQRPGGGYETEAGPGSTP